VNNWSQNEAQVEGEDPVKTSDNICEEEQLEFTPATGFTLPPPIINERR